MTVEEASARIRLYNRFMSRIEELGLPAAVDAKPVLDVCLSGFHFTFTCFTWVRFKGREVIQTLSASKAGSWTGQVLAKVMEWQLQHPDQGKEECKTWLKGEQVSGRIVVDEGTSSAKRGKGGGNGDESGGHKKAKR
jgi:tRNA nucleotidyltransferase (CCA-adding enzyme)